MTLIVRCIVRPSTWQDGRPTHLSRHLPESRPVPYRTPLERLPVGAREYETGWLKKVGRGGGI
jgi:hypothetical protein